MDSIEAEFGYDWSDGGHRSNVTGQTGHRHHGPVQPSPLTMTTNRAPSRPTQTNLASTTQQGTGAEGYSQGYLPPPTYQAALDGSDGGVTAAGGRDGYEWPIEDPPMPVRGGAGGPKSRSTPLIREGMRRRGRRQREGDSQSQQQQEQGTQREDNPLFAPDSGLIHELDTL